MSEPAKKYGRTRNWVWVALALLLILALLGTGLHWSGALAFMRGWGVARMGPLTVFYSCDTNGQIEPCRCSSGQTGGMGRRLGWLASQKAKAALRVDAGNITAGGQDWQMFEFQYILKGYVQAGYHGVNLGHRELELGRDRLRALRSEAVPFVSANVFDDKGELIFEPYRIVRLPGGMRVAILGIVDTDYEPAKLGPNLRVWPPAEALARWLPRIKGKADVTVLLAFASESAIEALAKKFTSIDLIVGGNTYRPTMGEPLHFGKSVVVLITGEGKGMGRLELEPAEGANRWTARNEVVMLTEDLPADKTYAAVYEDFKRELIQRDFRLADRATSHSLPRSAQADQYAGAAACRECHAKAFQVWSESRHARAFASLQAQNNHFNPRCLPCHTVGYGATDGYFNPTLTPTLRDVQCEACHGRGGYHIRVSRGEKIPARQVVLRKADCTACHNTERSPGFDFETAWKKIEHREK